MPTEDDGQEDGGDAEPGDLAGEEEEQTEDDGAEDDQDDGFNEEGNIRESEPGGLAINYDPRNYPGLRNLGPYAGFDTDSMFPSRFSEPGRLLREPLLMLCGAPAPSPSQRMASPPRGRDQSRRSAPDAESAPRGKAPSRNQGAPQ